jgi:hypothetical protein
VPQPLTVDIIRKQAAVYATSVGGAKHPALYGQDNGKRIGTYLEQGFRDFLKPNYIFEEGSAAEGLDFPSLEVDVKTTSIKQPQSSCPFRNAEQKIYGLGYHLLLFVYQKEDDAATKTAKLNIQHVVFIQKERTGDYTLTRLIRSMISEGANTDDIFAALEDRNIPLEESYLRKLAEAILKNPPEEGYLTISNALQWRLQYNHAIRDAGKVPGLQRLT